VYEESTGMIVAPRHPYAGALVYTAFSGSHQDAIKKGMARVARDPNWQVPYLPIDPVDVGRTYDPIIRINSQSGKGGVAYILEQRFGLQLPRVVQQAFSQIITRESDRQHKELLPNEIRDLFYQCYVNLMEPIKLISYREEAQGENEVTVTAMMVIDQQEKAITGQGNGLLDAFTNALQAVLNLRFEIADYHEHALTSGTKSKAITYVQIKNERKQVYIGAGISSSISKSSLRAVVSAANRMITTGDAL
jgi:2-isopropylmalate synthase